MVCLLVSIIKKEDKKRNQPAEDGRGEERRKQFLFVSLSKSVDGLREGWR